MTLVESKHEFETTKKLIENDRDITESMFSNVTIPFIETFVLKNPGDYCVYKTIDGVTYLSIVAKPNKNKKGTPQMVHLPIETSKKEVEIKGMLFASAKSIGQLIYQLRHEHIDILSGVLDMKISMNHFLDTNSTVMHNIHWKGNIVKDKMHHFQDVFITIYTGEMKFADGKIKEVLFEEITSPDKTKYKVFFEKLVNGKALSTKNLPIRLPIGAIINPPTLIFEQNGTEIGCSLEHFLKFNYIDLDLSQRIKLCSSVVRILSELHHMDIYHGASRIENFYVEQNGNKNSKTKNFELVFNGANGLIFEGITDNTVSIVDYDSNAPEVAFTRKLTKESGVFNMGRLFEQILKPDLIKAYKDQPEPRALEEMRHLIARATHPNPSRRPTMHGIIIMIRDVLLLTPDSSSSVNIVHFNQFSTE
uniref:Protein kinase domain-containing protein n=1 Tax=Caenorhabditis tropicalis TaxID=1561998 RepID=A0A1I7UNQ7_9PELO